MRIKKIPLIICIVLLITLFPFGVSAAATEHDVSQADVVLTDSCGDSCPGHVITGTSHFANKIQILSGEHKVTLKNLDVLSGYPGVTFAVEAGAKVDATIEGEVHLNGEIGIESHGKLNIFGDETSGLYVSGLHEGIYVTDDLTVKGGKINFGTGSFPGEAGEVTKHHLCALLAEGVDVTVTFEDADVRAVNNGYNVVQPYFTENTGYDNIAACGIKAPKLVVKNSELKVQPGNVYYKDGLQPKAIGLDVNKLSVKDSEVNVVAGHCYNSYGIRCTEYSIFTNSDVSVTSGTAENESIGFEAINASSAGVYGNSSLTLTGGTSDYISVGGHFNMMDAKESTVYAHGGKANRYSAGMVGGMLSAIRADVKGYGNVATDTDVVDQEGVFSEGLFFETIYGFNSEIYGEGGKAMISTGISSTEITTSGGAICGNGSDESEDSIGIYLTPSETAEGTPIPVKFEVVGGDIVARGETQGLLADTDDFAGVSYKTDNNAEAQIKTDLEGKEFLFGNKYKVSYIGGDVEAENLPADGAYYRDQWYTLPKEVPTAAGYRFMGWRDAYGTFFDVQGDHNVSMGGEDMVYTAVWKCLSGKNCPLRKFSDLNAKAWYHDGIEHCLERELMQGMSKTTFAPDTATTRAMIVAVLYRLDGNLKVDTKNDFTDVPAKSWYTDAVNWAVECDIVKGYEDGSFRPDQPVTREELAAFIFRMAEYYGLDTAAPELPKQFTDKADVSKWAVPALAWAVDQDIINGLDKKTLAPRGNATRAQLATMLYRFELSLIGEA